MDAAGRGQTSLDSGRRAFRRATETIDFVVKSWTCELAKSINSTIWIRGKGWTWMDRAVRVLLGSGWSGSCPKYTYKFRTDCDCADTMLQILGQLVILSKDLST